MYSRCSIMAVLHIQTLHCVRHQLLSNERNRIYTLSSTCVHLIRICRQTVKRLKVRLLITRALRIVRLLPVVIRNADVLQFVQQPFKKILPKSDSIVLINRTAAVWPRIICIVLLFVYLFNLPYLCVYGGVDNCPYRCTVDLCFCVCSYINSIIM